MRAKRWVVEEGNGTCLGDIVRCLGEDVTALEEGRVFLGERRVRDARTTVDVGDVVEIAAGRPSAPVSVVDRRGGLVVLLKGPGVPTEPDRTGAVTSLVEIGARLLGIPRREVHAWSRLDVGVSGLVLVATTAAARGHLDNLRSREGVRKRYVGIAERVPAQEQGEWKSSLCHAGRTRNAVTRYAKIAVAPRSSALRRADAVPIEPTLLALEPETGRWHQLRLHAAEAGLPLLGDRRHGGSSTICGADGAVTSVPRIALEAHWLELYDERGRPWVIRSAGALDLRALWLAVGGQTEDFDTALDWGAGRAGRR